MTYEVKWHSRASRSLSTLDKNVIARITKKLDQVKQNPFRYLEPYAGESKYKLRIGKYRALVTVNLQHRVLLVRVLDKRGRIYKRRKG